MDKRLPLLTGLLGVILLAGSLAYWFLQLYQPPQRPIAAVPHTGMPEPGIDAAATLFGGQVATASATNYQLTGIVAAGRDSAAIIVAEGSPPKALKVGKEVAPGITLAEVHPRYVMLSDGGVMKRLDLAADAKPAAPMGGPAVQGAAVRSMPANLAPGAAVPEPPMSPGAVQQPPVPPQGPVAQSSTFPDPGNPGQVSGPPEEPAPATPNTAVPNNPNNPNNPNSAHNPAPAPVQMPPPTRSTGSPVGGPAPNRQ